MFLVYLSIRNYVYVKPFYSTQSRRKLFNYTIMQKTGDIYILVPPFLSVFQEFRFR